MYLCLLSLGLYLEYTDGWCMKGKPIIRRRSTSNLHRPLCPVWWHLLHYASTFIHSDFFLISFVIHLCQHWSFLSFTTGQKGEAAKTKTNCDQRYGLSPESQTLRRWVLSEKKKAKSFRGSLVTVSRSLFLSLDAFPAFVLLLPLRQSAVPINQHTV